MTNGTVTETETLPADLRHNLAISLIFEALKVAVAMRDLVPEWNTVERDAADAQIQFILGRVKQHLVPDLSRPLIHARWRAVDGNAR